MFTETKSIWRYLQSVKKPVVMYGMGDGADKILSVMKQYKLEPAAFMASDDFVRGHSFHGFKIQKLSDIEAEYDEFIILICFGTSKPDVLERIYNLSERYELYAPDVPVYGDGLFEENYIGRNIKKIVQVREMLADDLSKTVYDRWIDYRISGKINHLRNAATPKEEAFRLLDIKKDKSECYVDLGAYNGDTIEEFLNLTYGRFKKIYAFEPDIRNFLKLKRKHYALNPSSFVPINAAAWDKDGKIGFSQRGGRHSYIDELISDNVEADNETKTDYSRIKLIQACSVDSIMQTEYPTLIKMDVEGCEAKALLGARNVIQSCKPKLIISLYHRTGDMLELPLLISKLNENYKMYLRHHDYIPAWDTNLYCV